MRRRAVRLWAALALEAAVAAAAVAAGLVPVGASPRALGIGLAVGALLFGVLGARPPALTGVPRRRLPLLAAKSGVLVAKSAGEEVLWRGLALGSIAGAVGVPARPPALTGVPRRRLPLLAAKSGVLVAKSAGEEVLWRGLALGWIAGAVGVPAAAAASTAGFALAHARPLGRRGVAVHLATGAAFAGACVAVSLAAAVAAHCAYNVLVAVALERERHRA